MVEASVASGIGLGLVALGAGIAIAVPALATAHVQATIGAAGMGLIAEKEGKEGNVLLYLALPETIVILGFVVAYLITSSLAGRA